MKHLILIFFAIFSTLLAKSIELPFEVKYCKHDTVYYYKVNNITNVKTMELMIVNRYNSNGLLENEAYYDYNTGAPILFSEHDYTYDAAKNKILDEQFKYYNNNKTPFEKFEYNYNANNQQVLFVAYSYDTSTNSYAPSRKFTSTYSSNKFSEGVYEYYDHAANVWVNSFKETYTYYPNDSIFEIIQYGFNITTNVFEFAAKIQNIFNSNNLKTSEITYNFSKALNDWYEYYVKECKYDATTQKLVEERYVDYGIPKLLRIDSFEFTSNNLTNYKSFDVINDEILIYQEIEFGYNEQNEVNYLYGQYDYDTASGMFLNLEERIFNCLNEDVSVDIINKNAAEIYPNPIVQGQTLNINNLALATTGIIYDARGVKMQAINLRKGNNQIATDRFAPGLYMLKIDNSVYKFVIN